MRVRINHIGIQPFVAELQEPALDAYRAEAGSPGTYSRRNLR